MLIQYRIYQIGNRIDSVQYVGSITCRPRAPDHSSQRYIDPLHMEEIARAFGFCDSARVLFIAGHFAEMVIIGEQG